MTPNSTYCFPISVIYFVALQSRAVSVHFPALVTNDTGGFSAVTNPVYVFSRSVVSNSQTEYYSAAFSWAKERFLLRLLSRTAVCAEYRDGQADDFFVSTNEQGSIAQLHFCCFYSGDKNLSSTFEFRIIYKYLWV